MYKENPENIVNSVPGISEISYGYSTIFIIYLVQSLIYIGIFGYMNSHEYLLNDDIVMNWVFGAYTILSLILFISIRKYSESYGRSACAIFLFILFFLFKICFFIILYKSFIDSFGKHINETSSQFSYDKFNSDFPLLFSNSATGAIYLALIIYSCIKKILVY